MSLYFRILHVGSVPAGDGGLGDDPEQSQPRAPRVTRLHDFLVSNPGQVLYLYLFIDRASML
jgi:hypothetical protein